MGSMETSCSPSFILGAEDEVAAQKSVATAVTMGSALMLMFVVLADSLFMGGSK